MEMVNKKNKSISYKSQYKVLMKHVNEFSEKYDCITYTNSVTEDFIEDFIGYLRDKNMRNNTVKGLIEKIKAMTKKAGNYGYAVNRTFDEISVPEEDTCSIALSMNEITRIYYYTGFSESLVLERKGFNKYGNA